MSQIIHAALVVLLGQAAPRPPIPPIPPIPPRAAPASPAPTSELAGYVYEVDTKQPLAGVTVTLSAQERVTLTDAGGRFSFDAVPLGTHNLQFQQLGLVAESLSVTVGPDKRLDIRVPMHLDYLNVIEITGRMSGSSHEQVVETTVNREQGTQVAGTRGDVVKVVQTMGGVARSRAGSSELVVWGASPADTRLYVDDVPVPRLFHIGGSRSILSSRNVSAVSLIPGGFGAAYGRAIGGMVKVTTSEPSKPRVAGFVSADPIDLSAGTSARLSPSVWSSVAARASVQNQALDLVAADRARELVPVSDYWDYQFKTQYDVNAKDTLEVLAFGVRDRVSRGIPSLTPDAAFVEDRTSAFHRLALRLERLGAPGVTNSMTAWIGVDDDETVMRFGTDRALAGQRSVSAGLRIEEQRRLRDWVTLRGGLDVELTRSTTTRDGALSLPAREGDMTVFGQPPGNRVNVDTWRTDVASVGAYLAASLSLADGELSVEPGLRFEPSMVNGNRVVPVRPTEPAVGYTELQPTLDPRLRVTWRPSSRARIYGAAGRYHQNADPSDLSPVFGTPALEQAEANQVLVGMSSKPTPWLTLDLTGFWIRQRDLAVRAPSATPALAELLVSTGQGRNYGAQAALRLQPSPTMFAWLTYSIMRAQRRGRSNEPWRLFDADQTHVAQAVASYRTPSGFEFGGRAQLATGTPRTPVRSALFNAGSGLYDPVFGTQNSIRIPAFFELSLRVAWQRQMSWGWVKFWVDVQNATNRNNAEEIIYTSDFSQRGFITGLPVLPLVGAEVRL